MPRPHIEPYDERPTPFKRMTLPGFGKGMHYKMLSMDTDTGACSLLVKFESGYKLPPGMSYSELEMFVVSGSVTYGDTTYGEGYYFLIPPGVSMPQMTVKRGAKVIMFYNYGFNGRFSLGSRKQNCSIGCLRMYAEAAEI